MSVTDNQNTYEKLNLDEVLFKKVLRIAQYESELDLGVNPKKVEQANVAYLSEQDFEYIKRVCSRVEIRLNDPDWLCETIQKIENKSNLVFSKSRGIRFDDELFKTGRGILENYNKK